MFHMQLVRGELTIVLQHIMFPFCLQENFSKNICLPFHKNVITLQGGRLGVCSMVVL